MSILLFIILSLVDSFVWTSNIEFSFIFVPYLLIFISVVKTYKRGFAPSGRFLLGVFSLFLGFIVYQLMEYNFIEANVYTVYALYFATIFEIIIFSSSMGIRFRYIEQEKNSAVVRFQHLLKLHEEEKSSLKSIFEQKSIELIENYAKAKQHLILLEKEVEKLSEIEGVAFFEGSHEDQKFVEQLISIIENNINNTALDGDFICKEMGLSKSVLYRKLQDANGISVNNFIRSIRLRTSMKLLKSKEHNVSEVAYLTGFNSTSYFTKSFKKEYNCSPSEI